MPTLHLNHSTGVCSSRDSSEGHHKDNWEMPRQGLVLEMNNRGNNGRNTMVGN